MRRSLAWATWVLGLLALFALLGSAKDRTLFIELEPNSEALPNANPTGTVVVGKFATSGGFFWMPPTGVIDLGGAFATGVSADGDTVVGGSPPRPDVLNAAIWVRATEWRVLGSFSPNAAPCSGQLSQANGVSHDGSVVVGSAYNGCGHSRAFRRQKSTGMVDLGSLVEGRPTRADGVSGDGRVVVGYQENADGLRRGSRWVDGREELFEGPMGPVGVAAAANVDDSIVTGAKCLLNVFEDQSAHGRGAGLKSATWRRASSTPLQVEVSHETAEGPGFRAGALRSSRSGPTIQD